MTIRNPRLLLKKSWVWEGEVTDLVRSLVQGWSISIPSGLTDIGDVRVDIDPNVKPDKVADIMAYPVASADEQFNTVISDPPWKINFYQRPKWFFKCVDLCKVGGRIIYNAPWSPNSKFVRRDEVIVRQSADFSNASLITVYTKIAESLEWPPA